MLVSMHSRENICILTPYPQAAPNVVAVIKHKYCSGRTVNAANLQKLLCPEIEYRSSRLNISKETLRFFPPSSPGGPLNCVTGEVTVD